MAAAVMAGSMIFGGFAAANPSACPAGQARGLVPGICYGLPPNAPADRLATSPDLVRQWQASATPEARDAVAAFFRVPRRPAEAKAFLEAWGNLAWNARVKSEQARDGADSLWHSASVFPLIFAMDALGGEAAKNFIPAWTRQLADERARWDRHAPAYNALRAYLAALPPDAPVSADAALEVSRQVFYLAGLSEASRQFLAQTATTVNAIRSRDGTLSVRLAQTGDALAAAGAFIGETTAGILRAALRGAGSLFGSLVPTWVWVVLVGAGGLLVYGVVSGNPLVGVARRALRRG